jgi:hypothetical protein
MHTRDGSGRAQKKSEIRNRNSDEKKAGNRKNGNRKSEPSLMHTYQGRRRFPFSREKKFPFRRKKIPGRRRFPFSREKKFPF